jgi:hypothetical protein
MPFFREFKDGGYAFGGRPFVQLLICAGIFDPAPTNRDRRRGSARLRRSLIMDPINIALWLILVAMIAIIPIGCVVTRRKSGDAPPPAAH